MDLDARMHTSGARKRIMPRGPLCEHLRLSEASSLLRVSDCLTAVFSLGPNSALSLNNSRLHILECKSPAETLPVLRYCRTCSACGSAEESVHYSVGELRRPAGHPDQRPRLLNLRTRLR